MHTECVHTHTHTQGVNQSAKQIFKLNAAKKKSFLATYVISIPGQVILISQHTT